MDFLPFFLFWLAVGLSVLTASFAPARRSPKAAAGVATPLVGPASGQLALTPRFLMWGSFRSVSISWPRLRPGGTRRAGRIRFRVPPRAAVDGGKGPFRYGPGSS